MSVVQLMQQRDANAHVWLARTVNPVLDVETWTGGNAPTSTFFTENLGSNVRILLYATSTTYMVVNEDNSWLTRDVNTGASVLVGHPALSVPSATLFFGAPGAALLNVVPTTDIIHGLGTGAWSDPTDPLYGWVATRFNVVRIEVATGVAVRYAGDGLHGCTQSGTFAHKQMWQGNSECVSNVAGAAFVQTATDGDGLVFFAEGLNIHVIDTTLSLATANVEVNVVDSSSLPQTWIIDDSAILLSSGGAVWSTGIAGEYLYVVGGTLSSDVINKDVLYVYNYLTNEMRLWAPTGQPFASIGGVHYVRAIPGGHATDVLLITGEDGSDAAWTVEIADVEAAFSTATAPPMTTPPVTTTPPPPPPPSNATLVPFSGDNIRVAQFRTPNRVVVRYAPNEVTAHAYDVTGVAPALLFTMSSAPYAVYSDAADGLLTTADPDLTTLYDHAGSVVSGPTAHAAISLGTVADATWWNVLEDGEFTGVHASTVVVATTAAIVLADRATGAVVAVLVGDTGGCANPTYTVGDVLIGSTMCAHDIVAPALTQTLSARFVYFQVTGSTRVFRLDVSVATGNPSVSVMDNFMSSFPPAPLSTLAPAADATHAAAAVSAIAFAGARPGEVFYVRPAAVFNAAPPNELLVWNSLDKRSRWVDRLNIGGAMAAGFRLAALHAARLQSGDQVILVGGTGTTTDFASVSRASVREVILPLVDECVAGIASCSATQVCEDMLESWTCKCPPGSHINGFNCDDDNECAGEGTGHDCDANATCGNTDPGFTCTCNLGFVGSGTTCGDINECAQLLACPRFAVCSNLVGSHSCACPANFAGNPTVLCYPTVVDETFAAGTPFGDSTAPTVLVGGNGGYLVLVDRSSTTNADTPITFSVTNPTEQLTLDFQGVVLTPDAALGVLFQVGGPLVELVLRNLIITGPAVYSLVAGSVTRVVLSNCTVDAPNANAAAATWVALTLDGGTLILNDVQTP
jgi:hypothetical protein